MNVQVGSMEPELRLSADGARLQVAGIWTVATAAAGEAAIETAAGDGGIEVIDVASVEGLDTAGTWLLVRLQERLRSAGARAEFSNIPERSQPLFEEIVAHMPEEPAPAPRRLAVARFLEKIGRRTLDVWQDTIDVLGILGTFSVGLASSLAFVTRLRVTSILNQFDLAGRQAVPIVTLMSFLIGAIIAQQGAFYLRQFGADIFVVDLAGVLVLRELGVLLTAIMVAGRSGSAITAELGSMKMREEIDALYVIGLRPVEVLVIPRILGLMLALPVLTFLSDLAALLGAGLMTVIYLDMPPDAYIARLREAVDLNTLVVGLVKAPVMALIIGLIAASEGLRVAGSAESLGRQTTVSVVKAIFMVIVVDGLFAIFFAAIDM